MRSKAVAGQISPWSTWSRTMSRSWLTACLDIVELAGPKTVHSMRGVRRVFSGWKCNKSSDPRARPLIAL